MPKPPAVLVLQLDSEKLTQDRLALAPFASAVGGFCFGATVEVVAATSTDDLHVKLAALVTRKCTFDVVVVIGHSNEDGIKIASDRGIGWDGFAGYVKPLHPRRLMLIACQAGRWPAAATLFKKLPLLRRIYASPVNATYAAGQLMIAMVPFLLAVKAPRNDAVLIAQTAIVALTGVQVRQWMRDHDKNDSSGVLLDLAAQAAHPLLSELPRAISSLFR